MPDSEEVERVEVPDPIRETVEKILLLLDETFRMFPYSRKTYDLILEAEYHVGDAISALAIWQDNHPAEIRKNE